MIPMKRISQFFILALKSLENRFKKLSLRTKIAFILYKSQPKRMFSHSRKRESVSIDSPSFSIVSTSNPSHASESKFYYEFWANLTSRKTAECIAVNCVHYQGLRFSSDSSVLSRAVQFLPFLSLQLPRASSFCLRMSQSAIFPLPSF